ncbi:MAG: hypothetical protein V3573_11370 [Desulfovibrionaceae bacterium]
MRLMLLFLVLTLTIVIGLERMQGIRTEGENWPPQVECQVLVTNNGPFYYVE